MFFLLSKDIEKNREKQILMGEIVATMVNIAKLT